MLNEGDVVDYKHIPAHVSHLRLRGTVVRTYKDQVRCDVLWETGGRTYSITYERLIKVG